MAAIFPTTLLNAFSWMKTFEYRSNCHWNLFLRVQLVILKHWYIWWPGADEATSHFLNQWWLFYWRKYASLGLNDTIWHEPANGSRANLLPKYFDKGPFKTLRSTQNGRRFATDNIKCIFLNENSEFQIQFHWSLLPRVKLPINQHWFR